MIPDEQFEMAFRGVLEDVLGWQVELCDSDSPETIEDWDSLAHIRLIHGLETTFDVRLPDSALLEPQDVAALKRLVRSHAVGV
jgi:acyl carrier protein